MDLSSPMSLMWTWVPLLSQTCTSRLRFDFACFFFASEKFHPKQTPWSEQSLGWWKSFYLQEKIRYACLILHLAYITYCHCQWNTWIHNYVKWYLRTVQASYQASCIKFSKWSSDLRYQAPQWEIWNRRPTISGHDLRYQALRVKSSIWNRRPNY